MSLNIFLVKEKKTSFLLKFINLNSVRLFTTWSNMASSRIQFIVSQIQRRDIHGKQHTYIQNNLICSKWINYNFDRDALNIAYVTKGQAKWIIDI